jgi:hypothetical protein
MSQKEDLPSDEGRSYSRRSLLLGWVGGVSTAVLGLSAASLANEMMGTNGNGTQEMDDGTQETDNGTQETDDTDGEDDSETERVDKANENAPPLEEIVGMLREGGYNIYFRHEMTQSGEDQKSGFDSEEPPEWYYSNCSLQRNLSLEGWRRAERVGEAFDELEVPVGEVLSSPYCRCENHAELAFDEYTATHDLNRDKGDFGDRVVDLLTQTPERGTNTAMVAHNLLNKLQDYPLSPPLKEGYMMVFDPAKSLEEGIVRIIRPDELIEFSE